MAGKRNNAKEKKGKAKSIVRRRTILIVVLSIILGCTALWYLTKNTSLYAPNKEQVKQEIQAGLDASRFRGDVAYSSIDDLGCDSRNSTGLATELHCDFLGQKYFRSTGDLAAHLREADEALVSSGWQRSPYSNGSIDDYEKVLSGASQNRLRYERAGYYAALVFYKKARWENVSDVGKLLDAGKIPALKDDEFLYGTWSYTSYWSCRWDSILTQPCPAPPSKPY